MSDQRANRYKNESSNRKQPSRLREVFSYFLILLIAFVAAWAVRTYVMEPYKIPSGSMLPTIQIGNHVFAEKITYRTQPVAAGDVVTFVDPHNPDVFLIKRVIAVGGQTVDLQEGHVVVNGKQLVEPYTHDKPSEPLAQTVDGKPIGYPFTVPEGYIWVMGDNRTNSADSRYFGAVPEKNVIGRAFFTFWPISEIGALE